MHFVVALPLVCYWFIELKSYSLLALTLEIEASMSERVITDQQTEALKMPPNSLEAERSVLGGLLLDNEAWDGVAERVMPLDFYRKDHQLIFEAMEGLAEKAQPFDVVTISEVLDQKNELEQVGGLAYLAEVARSTPSASNIVAYAEIVRERSTLRQLIRASNKIAENSFDTQGRTSDELLNEAERLVFEISESRPKFGGPEV